MILVDTTVWIDFFAGKSVSHVAVLEEIIAESGDICTCGFILTELLQGIRDDGQYSTVKKYMQNIIYLPVTYHTFIRAADIYRGLRKKGVTIRNAVDCLIAAVSIEHKIPLLHNDRDFDCIENNCALIVLKSIKA